MHDLLPQSIRKLLAILDNVKKVVAIPMPRIRLQKKAPIKPPESATKVSARVLIPTRIKSPKRWELRKAACCARSMGARTQPTIPVSAVSMRKMELLKGFQWESSHWTKMPWEWQKRTCQFLRADHGTFLEIRENGQKVPEKLAKEEMSLAIRPPKKN